MKKHLSSLQITMVAEYLYSNGTLDIDEQLMLHVEDCKGCKFKCLQAYEDLKASKSPSSNGSSPTIS